ncbi:MAG: tripartite tricarboxylate transporter permease [Candidatus Diapherotrites archaeon]
MIELFLWIAAGCVLGVFTGLTPGIHLNTMALFVVFFAEKGNFPAVLLIVAMSVMHSFMDFIPSVFLGAPSEKYENERLLPGHKLLLKGEGLKAVKIYSLGGLFGIICALLLVPALAAVSLKWFEFIYAAIPFLLLSLIALMVFSEKGANRKIWALAVVGLSGVLGFIALKNTSTENALFALISGFFGAATIAYSFKKNPQIKRQKKCSGKYPAGKVLRASLAGAVAGSLVSLFPSISSSQAAFVAVKFLKKISTKSYIVLLGAINSSNMFFGFLVLFLLGKARNGAVVAVKQIIEVNAEQLLLIIATVLFCSGIAAIASEFFAEKFAEKIAGFDYRKVNLAVLLFLAFFVMFLAGLNGLLLFVTSSALGIVALTSNVKRSHCLAFLMAPTIAFYLHLGF